MGVHRSFKRGAGHICRGQQFGRCVGAVAHGKQQAFKRNEFIAGFVCCLLGARQKFLHGRGQSELAGIAGNAGKLFYLFVNSRGEQFGVAASIGDQQARQPARVQHHGTQNMNRFQTCMARAQRVRLRGLQNCLG